MLNKLKQQLSNPFIHNFGWLTGAEAINRISRLGVIVILARMLSSYDYGLVAVVLTTNEFANVFTFKAGIGSKLIQAHESELPLLCETAYWMNWILGAFLFCFQCAIAFVIAHFYNDNQIILPICAISLVYLVFPNYAVQVALIQRENRLKITALCNALQSLIGSALTVFFAFLGLGMWSIILPVILTSPIWLIINRMNHSWRSKSYFTLYRWSEILAYASNILGVDLLNKLRANLDYLLVGYFLGIEELGIYYFAFNAGLSISVNILNNLTWSLFPYYCAVKESAKLLRQRYFDSFKKISLLIIPLILAQAFLAPIYVPIVFGNKWNEAIPILMLICLSALPRPFADAASILLESIGKVRINLYYNILFTVFFTISILIGAQFSIFWVAMAVLLTHSFALPIFTVWASKYVFAKRITPLTP